MLPEARAVPLPTYAFQHEAYWLASSGSVVAGLSLPGGRAADSGPDLAGRLAGLSGSEAEALVTELVRTELAAVTGVRSPPPESARPSPSWASPPSRRWSCATG